MKEYHLIEPIYDKDSKILILGSFPSVKSREANFFYHHPQNRFWRVLAAVYQDTVPEEIADKKAFLKRHQIALWDVIASCNIKGSSDSSISDVEVNDLNMIIANSSVKHIYTNGNLADKLYHRYFDAIIDLPVTKLPSTSPANAAYSLDKLLIYWRVINE
ncbi:DNA-deoxyinosine glycosylase [Erysipelatoclostridium sp. An15]|uniref:DNA-deoxyinosine glycosylase n=1 Tax=unclassified Thomasclavelia TaxID=3025756 RepID=UPI000B390AB3|nr:MULTISPECIES: DNA-deoxyinosine glycosylase [unclassified Thomasclavelia]OUP78853.1 DNA-deoxyinosine glycosylase [Erysipelatoclostridium sp. An173]OUQ08394.1 DNA-deoxyinosine glycosylase [Erysipelatoclostridium sp. An15]